MRTTFDLSLNDLSGPDGNVFAILGAFRRFTRELEKGGVDTTEHHALLNGYSKMDYDQILDKVEAISHGAIRFTGRKQEGDDE